MLIALRRVQVNALPVNNAVVFSLLSSRPSARQTVAARTPTKFSNSTSITALMGYCPTCRSNSPKPLLGQSHHLRGGERQLHRLAVFFPPMSELCFGLRLLYLVLFAHTTLLSWQKFPRAYHRLWEESLLLSTNFRTSSPRSSIRARRLSTPKLARDREPIGPERAC